MAYKEVKLKHFIFYSPDMGATALNVTLQTHISQQKRLQRFRGVKPTVTIVQASGEATTSMATVAIMKMFKVIGLSFSKCTMGWKLLYVLLCFIVKGQRDKSVPNDNAHSFRLSV